MRHATDEGSANVTIGRKATKGNASAINKDYQLSNSTTASTCKHRVEDYNL